MPFKKGVKPDGAKPFKKGETGNPHGRPKKLPELDKLLDDVLGVEKDGKTEAEQILISLTKNAKNGDVRAAEVLLDRAYGKVRQPIDIEANVQVRPDWLTEDIPNPDA